RLRRSRRPGADPGPGPQTGPHPRRPDRLAPHQPRRPGGLRRRRPAGRAALTDRHAPEPLRHRLVGPARRGARCPGPLLRPYGHAAGTLRGAVYADRYPQHVRAFVLDGPIDPSPTLDQMTLAQAVGFEGALRSFFAWCDATATCRWRPANPDRTAAFVALMDR